jgi:hypothetical protein
VRRLLQLVIALVVFGLCVVPSPATSGPSGPADVDPANHLADCIAQRGHLLVLFLVDESGSLEDTDPSATRVTGMQTALAGLESLRTSFSSDNRPTIDIAMAGFSVGYDDPDARVAWEEMGEGTADRMRSQAEQFADRHEGFDTDYVAALMGAQRELAERSTAVTSDGGDQPCKALVWFTDGEFDIEDRTSGSTQDRFGTSKPWRPDVPLTSGGSGDQLELIGLAEHLCNAGGLADQLRRDEVLNITVALSTQIPPEKLAVLERIATGEAGGVTCGTEVANGIYVPGANADDLPKVFYELPGQIGDGTPQEPSGEPGPPCPGSDCPEGRREFVIDPGIRRFNLLALPGGSEIDIALRAPDVEEPLVIPSGDSGTASLGDVEIEHTWVSPDAVVVDADLTGDGDGSGAGTWSVTFIDRSGGATAMADVEVYVYGDLVPRLDDADELRFRRGEPVDFSFTVQSESGAPGSAEVFDAVTATATVTDPETGEAENVPVEGPDGDGRYHGTYQAPESYERTLVNLSLTVDAVTDSGLALRPVVRSSDVPVLAPSSYPQVEPAELHLSGVVGNQVAEGEITVRGGEATPGCVWIDGSTIDEVPETVGDVPLTFEPDITSRETCLRVEAGDLETITVSADPDAQSSGTVAGNLHVRISSEAAEADVLSQEMPLSFSTALEVDEGTRWLVFAALLLAGILIPLVGLQIINRIKARFEPLDKLRVASVAVVLEGDRLRKADVEAGPSGLFETDDGLAFVRFSEDPERTRGFERHGVAFAAKAPPLFSTIRKAGGLPQALASPFTNRFLLPYGEATPKDPDTWIASGWRRATAVPGDSGRVSLALPGTWLFLATTRQLGVGAEGTSAAPSDDEPSDDEPGGVDAPPVSGGGAPRPGRIEGRIVAFIERHGDVERHVDALVEQIDENVSNLVDRLHEVATEDVVRRHEAEARKAEQAAKPSRKHAAEPGGADGLDAPPPPPPAEDVGWGVSGPDDEPPSAGAPAEDGWGVATSPSASGGAGGHVPEAPATHERGDGATASPDDDWT